MKGWKRAATRFFREPFVYFFITVPFVWFFGLFYVVGKRYGVFSWSFLEKILSIVFWGWFLPSLGIPAFELWLTNYLTQVLGTVVFHMEHSINPPYRQHKGKWTFEGAALQGSTFLKVPYLFKDFTCAIEYHHIHHLNTSVPSYNLQKCHEEFEVNSKAGTKWDDLHIHRIDLLDILKSLGNVMYDEETEKLVPFDYKLL
jgi:acyl-lipid omega-6 desaturase (Delta-12 desaturase)